MRAWMQFCFYLTSLLVATTSALAAVENPQVMLRTTADRVLAEVSARKSDLESNPQLIYPLVEETVLPHFNFRSMTQSAVGRYWRDATEAQREKLTFEFRELLVRTYATALLGYSGQTIEYLPVKYRPGDTQVMIPTRIASSGAPPIPINYRLKLEENAKWLIFDVVIDGVSLITNYRGQFSGVTRRDGIDGLIEALAAKNRQTGK